MYAFGSGWEVRGVSGLGLALTNTGRSGESRICVCVLVAVVLGGVGGRIGPGSERLG